MISKVLSNLMHETSDLVDIPRGFRQGSPLSPFLLVMVLDLAITRCCELWKSKGMGIKIDEALLSILAFAGDILLFSNNPSDLATMASDLSNALAEIGLSINWGKCSWTCNVEEDLIIRVQGTLIPYSPASTGFPYLGTPLTLDGRAGVTLDHRISAAWRVFYSRVDVWSSKSSVDSKTRTFKLTIEACALFGCESWHLTRKEQNSLDTTLCHMLREVLRSWMAQWKLGLSGGDAQVAMPKRNGWTWGTCPGLQSMLLGSGTGFAKSLTCLRMIR